jgi:hypothetical protein
MLSPIALLGSFAFSRLKGIEMQIPKEWDATVLWLVHHRNQADRKYIYSLLHPHSRFDSLLATSYIHSLEQQNPDYILHLSLPS